MPEEAFSGSNATEQAVTHEIGAQTQEPSSTAELGEDNAHKSPSLEKETQPPNGQKPREQLSRYERTKRERAAFRAQQAQFQQERDAFARERAQFEEQKKPRRDYTLADLKKYRTQWEQEGNFDLVDKADKEIAVMQAEEQAERAARTVELPPLGSPEHLAQWQAAERELAQADPEFMRQGTPLDRQLRQIMGSPDGDIYRQHPRGIVAAYHRARMELLETDMKGLQTENSKLKNELQRLTGLTSIDGGALGQLGNGSRIESAEDFARLSTKDMRKHLMRTAQRGGTPWF